MIDNTSQRKLAYVQRLILLNFKLSFITDNYYHHVLIFKIDDWEYYWSRVNFILFFHIFQIQLLAYNLEKCLHLVVIPRITTNNLSHMDLDTCIFGILEPQCVGSQSNPCFLKLLQANIPKTWDNQSTNPVHLSSNRGKYQIFGIFPPINHFISQKLKPTPNIQDWTPALQQISQIIQGIPYSYRHLLNWQCWDWY